MVEEENEEFVNFSDEENAVTIPLDVFPTLVHHDTKRANSFNESHRHTETKIDSYENNADIIPNDISPVYAHKENHVVSFGDIVGEKNNGNEIDITGTTKYNTGINQQPHKKGNTDDLNHGDYINATDESQSDLSDIEHYQNDRMSPIDRRQTEENQDDLSKYKIVSHDSAESTVASLERSEIGVEQQLNSNRSSVSLVTREEDVIIRSECRTPTQFDFLHHLRKSSKYFDLNKGTSYDISNTNDSLNENIGKYDSSNDRSDEHTVYDTVTPYSSSGDETDENSSLSDLEGSFELESHISGIISPEPNEDLHRPSFDTGDTESESESVENRNTVDDHVPPPDRCCKSGESNKHTYANNKDNIGTNRNKTKGTSKSAGTVRTKHDTNRLSYTKRKSKTLSYKTSRSSSNSSLYSQKIAWKSNRVSSCSNHPESDRKQSGHFMERTKTQYTISHTTKQRDKMAIKTTVQDRTTEKELRLKRVYGKRLVPEKQLASARGRRNGISDNSKQSVTSPDKYKQTFMVSRNSSNLIDLKLPCTNGKQNMIDNHIIIHETNNITNGKNRYKHTLTKGTDATKKRFLNINDLHTEIKKINENNASSNSTIKAKSSVNNHVQSRIFLKCKNEPKGSFLHFRNDVDCSDVKTEKCKSLFNTNESRHEKFDDDTSRKGGNTGNLEPVKCTSTPCYSPCDYGQPSARYTGSHKYRQTRDTVNRCNNISDNVNSQNTRILSKIESHDDHVTHRSQYALKDMEKNNHTHGILPSRLLHEDARTGNCNIKPPNKRYNLNTRTASNDGQNSGYNGVNFHPNGQINKNSYKTENLTFSNKVGKTAYRNRQTQLTPCKDNTNKCNSFNGGARKAPNGTNVSGVYTQPVRSVTPVKSNFKTRRGYSLKSRDMSGKVRQRNSSGLTDLARLQDIRRELLLAEPEDTHELYRGRDTSPDKHDSLQPARTIVSEMLLNERGKTSRQTSSDLKEKRFTTTDANGRTVLCCILQAPTQTRGLSGFTCDIMDPLDVPRATGNHELLISHVIRCTPPDTIDLKDEDEILVTVPVAHEYVQLWQEIVVKWLDIRDKWVDTEDQVELIQIDKDGKGNEFMYGVQFPLKDLGRILAVLARPTTDSVVLGNHSMAITSTADPSVKMRVPVVTETDGNPKIATLQVIPLDRSTLMEFRNSRFRTQNIDITAASSLIIMNLNRPSPETVSFVATCVQTTQTSGQPETEKKTQNTLTGSKLSRDVWTRSLTPAKDQRPPQKVVITKTPPRSTKRNNDADAENKHKHDMHLVQIGEDSDVRLKLLTDTDRDEAKENNGNQTVRFSVYEKSARCFTMKTKSGLPYDEMKKLAQTFTNFLIRHRVELKVGQHAKNVNSVHLSMNAYLPCSKTDKAKSKEFAINCNRLHTVIQIDEGDLVAIMFRRNINVLNQRQVIYSYNACRGITETFTIQVADPFSQRSLQNFHGELKIFVLRGPRTVPINRMEMPAHGSDWELRAECPLILPKIMKKTPVNINKAPISLRFQEPLTVDFVNKICTDLVGDWELFARSLGLTHARLQSIKQQNRNVISERMLMDVVVCWMKQQPVSRDKVGPLLGALRKCNKWKLVAELSHRHQALSTDKSKSVRDKYLQRSMALICKSKHVTCKWQQLYRHLIGGEIPEEEVRQTITSVESKYDNDVTRCYRALCRWKSDSKNTPSVWQLVDALRFCNCSVAAGLFAFWARGYE